MSGISMVEKARKSVTRSNTSPELKARNEAMQNLLRDNVRFILEGKHASPSVLAEASEVSVQAVSLWKTTGQLTFSNLVALAKHSGFSTDQILTTNLSDTTSRSQVVTDPDEMDLLLAYRDIRPDEQEKTRNELMRQAEASRKFVAEMLERMGAKSGPATDERVAKYIKPAPKGGRKGAGR